MTTLTIIGQIHCGATDAPVQGPDVPVNKGYILQGLPVNTEHVFINTTSDMSTTDSFALDVAQQITVTNRVIANLNELWFLPVVANEVVAYWCGL
jgi:hypothetical protein